MEQDGVYPHLSKVLENLRLWKEAVLRFYWPNMYRMMKAEEMKQQLHQ